RVYKNQNRLAELNGFLYSFNTYGYEVAWSLSYRKDTNIIGKLQFTLYVSLSFSPCHAERSRSALPRQSDHFLCQSERSRRPSPCHAEHMSKHMSKRPH